MSAPTAGRAETLPAFGADAGKADLKGRRPLGARPGSEPNGQLRAPGDRRGEVPRRRLEGGRDCRREAPRRRRLGGGQSHEVRDSGSRERQNADEVGRTPAARLGDPRIPALAIASDNGKEFAGHASAAAGFYFAQPCHSRVRGPDEHANRLTGVCFPKKTDFRSISDAEVREVENRPDARPRKALGFRTPGGAAHVGTEVGA